MNDIFQGLMTESWLQTVSIIGATFAAFYYFHKDVRDEINEINQNFNQSMIAQTKRTDRLYEMFIDLIKETRR